MQWRGVWQGLTTNEMINARRYHYLQGERGEFRNPFDRGVVGNARELFAASVDYERLFDVPAASPAANEAAPLAV